MRNLCHRQSFCEEFSSSIIRNLNKEFQKELLVEKCLLQRTKHPAKKKQRGFVLSKTMLELLRKQFCDEDFTEFFTVLERCFDSVITESQTWEIPVRSWQKQGSNYVFEVDKTTAFGTVVQGILNFSQQPMQTPKEANFYILCHVHKIPTIDDIRSLLYCSLLEKYISSNKGSVMIFLSSDNEIDRKIYDDVFKNLNLDHILYKFAEEGFSGSGENEVIPERFSDCLSCEENHVYKRLSVLRRRETETAFTSKILCTYKNTILNNLRCSVEENKSSPTSWIHVCNQKNQTLAQQSELFHAWYKDKHCSSDDYLMKDIVSQSDEYLCHAGVQESGKVEATTFLEARRRQIKESFESKLQVNLEGADWGSVFHKMRAAVVRIEFLNQSLSNRMKLSFEEDTLPTDTTFVLYNYSRLSMLLDSHDRKVEEGYYPPLCAFDEVDFGSLTEDAEWELLIDHLWNFCDIVSKPLTISNGWKMTMNCHHVVSCLQQLCRSHSAFYSRHHILGENFTHLIPEMNARIHLMKAVKKAMSEVFDVLGVEPLTQM